MLVEMSAALNVKTKHASNVHDELQQLSLETPSLFQRSTIRGKLQIISRLLIYVHLRHVCHV